MTTKSNTDNVQSKLCSTHDCNRVTFGGSNECVLHCEKMSYQEDYEKGILSSFYNELIDYIVDTIDSNYGFLHGLNLLAQSFSTDTAPDSAERNERDKYKKFLLGELDSDFSTKEFKTYGIVINWIKFPDRNDSDDFDYLKPLIKLPGIWFSSCVFNASEMDLENTKVLYQRCVFQNDFTVTQTTPLAEINNTSFQNCQFLGDVIMHGGNFSNFVIDHPYFSDCEFNERISFNKTYHKTAVFNNNGSNRSLISSIAISNSIFKEKFSLNNCVINHAEIFDTIFEKKFEFKNNALKWFRIYNVNHLDIADYHGTKFLEFTANRSSYSEIVVFEECMFGDSRSRSSITKFTYITFMGFANFRHASFDSGLDISRINHAGLTNFLGVTISPASTNRETYRLIKDSFDKIGNHIEANRFFVYEMKKYKKELKGSGVSQERFIFFLNEFTSNFGQSYIRPIFLIFLLGFVFYLFELGYQGNYLYSIYPPANTYISHTADFFNNIALSILPVKKFLIDGMEFISLIFYGIFAGLAWQTVVALKRHAKR